MVHTVGNIKSRKPVAINLSFYGGGSVKSLWMLVQKCLGFSNYEDLIAMIIPKSKRNITTINYSCLQIIPKSL